MGTRFEPFSEVTNYASSSFISLLSYVSVRKIHSEQIILPKCSPSSLSMHTFTYAVSWTNELKGCVERKPSASTLKPHTRKVNEKGNGVPFRFDVIGSKAGVPIFTDDLASQQ